MYIIHSLLFSLFLLSSLLLAASARPTPRSRALLNFDWNSVALPFMKDYSEFQISDGYGGTAEEEAIAVFIKPFEGTDLSSVPYEVFDKLKLAKEVTEDIEVEAFEPAIAKAGEDNMTGQALAVGLAKNRVLFATARVQALEIEAAHNRAMGLVDPYEEEDLGDARAYLAWTVEADKENDGQLSLGVT